MKTIEEILSEHITGDALIPEGLADALREREQEAMDTLAVVGSEFGLIPAIVAKVICMLGLGTPCEGEARKHVDEQYAALLAQIEEQRQTAIRRFEAAGIPATVPEFKDPLADGLPTGMTIPDTPEE